MQKPLEISWFLVDLPMYTYGLCYLHLLDSCTRARKVHQGYDTDAGGNQETSDVEPTTRVGKNYKEYDGGGKEVFQASLCRCRQNLSEPAWAHE